MTPLTQVAHKRLSERLKPGDIAIDATLGNGHDALFLLKSVTPGGFLYGFDVQSEAVEHTRHRLLEEGRSDAFRLYQRSHADLAVNIDRAHRGRISAVVYNLGYLPGGMKTISTQRESTIESLDQAIELLEDQGILSVMCYRGHAEGARELEGVEKWAASMTSKYRVEWIDAPSTRRLAPRLLWIIR